MPARHDKPDGIGDFHLLHTPSLDMNADAILADFTHYFGRLLGRRVIRARSPFVYQAVAYATRDRLTERWARSSLAQEQAEGKRTAYLSLEFLMGRLLRNNLLNLGIYEATTEALHRLGLNIEEVETIEHDAGLGNGGLGRLAACFLDSCATLGLPVIGYGIRYRYGMFRQRIENGWQVEEPDPWLREGFPWEIERFELARTVRFGGRSESWTDSDGVQRHRWVNTHDVLAIPYDVPVPGYRNDIVNTLRLWSAAATDEFDLEEFNAGSYTDAVAEKNAAENITMVLYPNATTEMGKELRLRQQYFFVSASLQDVLGEWSVRHGDDFGDFASRHCFQLNDTHPAIAVAELMRLLIDHHRLSWEQAWMITTSTMAYTNHTLLPEALECWNVAMFRQLLPRLLDIILEINTRFLAEVRERWPGDNIRVQQMSLVDEGSEPRLRMAHLAIVGSFSVNGVAELHSRLIKADLFANFNELWPGKFNNKTNGVTHRRWLAACNPKLGHLITEVIGDNWVRDLPALSRLEEFATDANFQDAWRRVKLANKVRLARELSTRCGLHIDCSMMFDVQVKRIHEYKRQLLNLLHVVHLYGRILRGDTAGMVPRVVIIGGKAAPGYEMAKQIIKCINDVAMVINKDPLAEDWLKLIFFPDYNVSAMELICPAAELSEQISTAGKEASGTGNMKFMMNGAVTIGTLDGANVEIRQAVGEENFFLFGLTVDEISALRGKYNPTDIVASDPALARVIDMLASGVFAAAAPGPFAVLVQSILHPQDPWMTAADFGSFVAAQQDVSASYMDHSAWTTMSILNSARSGHFSTDRTINDYNDELWHLTPLQLPGR
ncbi:MAG TPA: glycogen/starch/alpha-glucan phosphorylase [Woeseiaceae bacterium]|nr:glycogen/starch/alpha-glucan phosphorylase [Woeseiaceae bacterium]